jgi:hypothetical protein
MKKALKIFGIALAALLVLFIVLAHIGHGIQEQETTQVVQAALQHAATLTPEQALIEGGKKDATPGWELVSALYDSKDKEVCYTYDGYGQGIKYERVYIDARAFAVYHSNGLIERSNGRLGYWEAGETDPCTLMKDIARDFRHNVVDLLLPSTPAPEKSVVKQHKTPKPENNCPLYANDGYHCNGSTQVLDTKPTVSAHYETNEQGVIKAPASTLEKEQCMKDYAAHPWYVVNDDGTKVVDANAACYIATKMNATSSSQ